MAEYKTKREYEGGQLSRKQVCAMNYTSGEMPPYFNEYISDCLVLACVCSHKLNLIRWMNPRLVNM